MRDLGKILLNCSIMEGSYDGVKKDLNKASKIYSSSWITFLEDLLLAPNKFSPSASELKVSPVKKIKKTTSEKLSPP